MTRRGLIKAMGGMMAMTSMANGAEKRPNVLFLVVDDLRTNLGCYGASHVHSPNIDRLASDGVLFERAYCQQATCGPSRASTLSGCRPETTGILDLQTRLSVVAPDVLTMPQHFKANGYETVSIGKVYHNFRDDQKGWSVPQWSAKDEREWIGRGYLTPGAAKLVAESDARPGAKPGLGPAYEAPDVEDNAYPDGMNADRAIAELDRVKDKPFFLAVGFHKPHLPFNSPKRYWDMYDPATLPTAEVDTPPDGAPPMALTDWGELRAYAGIPKKGPLDDELARTLIHAYCACVSYVDAQIGRVLAELDRHGLRDNTIVVLWGDHGWKLGDYGCWSKHTNFELDTRVPLLLSAPGKRGAGTRTKALVELIDIYPTLCAMTGLSVPDHLESIGLEPLIDDPDRPWKTAAFSLFPRQRDGRKMMGRSMRTDRYRYNEWTDIETGELVARELYDHEVDPRETVNRASREENRELVEALGRRLKAGWKGAAPRG